MPWSVQTFLQYQRLPHWLEDWYQQEMCPLPLAAKASKIIHQVMIDPLGQLMELPSEGIVALPGEYMNQIALYENALASLKHGGIGQYDLLEKIALTPSIDGEAIDSCMLDGAEVLIDKLLSEGKRVFILSDHIAANKALLKRMENRGWNVSYIDGEVVDTDRNEQRRDQIKQFREGKNPLLIATNGTMSTAENLPETDVVITLNFPWTAATYDQGVGRGLRAADTNSKNLSVEVYNLVFKHSSSIYTEKWNLIQNKRVLDELFIRGNLTPHLLKKLQSLEEQINPQPKRNCGDKSGG